MTKTVNTAGKIVAFVEVEEDARDFYIDRSNLLFDLSDNKADLIKLPVGNWQILGDSRKLTESDIKPLVVQVDDEWRSAIELWSLLKEANGIVDSNPLGEEPDFEKYRLVGRNEQERKMIAEDTAGIKPSWASIFRSNYQDKLKAWQQAQSLVKRFLVLVSQE